METAKASKRLMTDFFSIIERAACSAAVILAVGAGSFMNQKPPDVSPEYYETDIESKRTDDMEPRRPCERPVRQDDLGPVPPPFIIPFKRRCRAIRYHKAQHRSNAAKKQTMTPSPCQQDSRSKSTYTVSNVGCTQTLYPFSFKHVMSTDHAPKKTRMCQHRKIAVARRALIKASKGLRFGPKLCSAASGGILYEG